MSNSDYVKCNNGPTGLLNNYRYTAPPPTTSPTQNVCPYACLSGFYGQDCSMCPTGVCNASGFQKRPCNDIHPDNDGNCSLPCTPQANTIFTSGCSNRCINASFYQPTIDGPCLPCAPSCTTIGKYTVSCTSRANTQCLDCTSNAGTQLFFTAPGDRLNDQFSCPFQCVVGYYFLNTTVNRNCDTCDLPPGPTVTFTSSGLMNNKTSCNYTLMNSPTMQSTTPPGMQTTTPSLTTTPTGMQTTTPSMTTTPPGIRSTTPSLTTTPSGIQSTTPSLTTTPSGMQTTTPLPVPTLNRSNITYLDNTTQHCNVSLWDQVVWQGVRDMPIGMARILLEQTIENVGRDISGFPVTVYRMEYCVHRIVITYVMCYSGDSTGADAKGRLSRNMTDVAKVLDQFGAAGVTGITTAFHPFPLGDPPPPVYGCVPEIFVTPMPSGAVRTGMVFLYTLLATFALWWIQE